MKKSLFFIFILFIVIHYNLKAVNFAFGFMSQFALSAASTEENTFPNGFRNFDTGFSFNIGINHDFNKLISLSGFIDLGYYHDSYDIKHTITNTRVVETYQFDSFLVGAVTKVNISFFSIGIGAGAKIPISSYYILDNSAGKRRYFFNYGDMKDIFENLVIPYVKIMLDFSIFNYLSLGLYVNYDFPIKFQSSTFVDNIIINKKPISGFDIGIQFGYLLNYKDNNKNNNGKMEI